MTIRIADFEWISAPTDTPANIRFEGVLGPAGVSTVKQIGFWPWGDNPSQAGAAQVQILNGNGLLDAAALEDLSGQAVAIQQVAMAGALAGAAGVARHVVDRIAVQSDNILQLTLRDAHDALDATLNPNLFAEDVPGLAGRMQPTVIGAVANVPVLLTGIDGSVGWMSDEGVGVAVLRDRGDPLEAGTWVTDPYDQQLLFDTPPLGPVTADISTVGLDVDGAPLPASMETAVRGICRRAGITAVNVADCAAIDAACGYAGVGVFSGDAITARQALQAVCNSYGAWYWQDGQGVLRFSRIVAPETAVSAADLEDIGMGQDLSFAVDLAPNLTRRMLWRPFGRTLVESELVTDLVDVPPELRAQMKQGYGGVAVAPAPAPSEYRHCIDADPAASQFWAMEDAQAEIERICAIYEVVRRFYVYRREGDTGFDPMPGQVLTLHYPRWGLAAGKKLLVRRVDRNPVTGSVTVQLWG